MEELGRLLIIQSSKCYYRQSSTLITITVRNHFCPVRNRGNGTGTHSFSRIFGPGTVVIIAFTN
jgi:hypothetical protein